ncbi:aromatic ring-hydroxylating dioxygenase subunit alpha [Leptolyngbyaceae cyanobacterium CCMR0081]|uniref:Aromatic ring-hydroxylating dioxygenase subunit alpha n=1 Tax=Adonisia turfae CCMR0081 TaxID=2292702 RepID=A0A6M0RW77_9CYAN|nr:Rieske 2Fe-2S domain-containing protein [Adonisia turfae]NEZ60073.1 aromatic ring-hydroxylating dioxygenase subunit alpha [Adonisia turfae CCMR0081]
MVSSEINKLSGHYPRGCTFLNDDWDAIAPFWFPIAFSHDVTDSPIAATLLDQRLVIWRTSQGVSVANDLCLHRGVPMSLGHINNDQLICKYHGFHYNASGACTLIPANPQASIPARLCLKTYPVREAFGLVWTTLSGDGSDANMPQLPEWDSPDYQPILPDSIDISAAVGRQMEGFLDVAHFAWVHHEAFADRDNPEVPPYTVTPTSQGLRAEYLSTVSNFPKELQHRAPADFKWLRVFDVFLPFAAILRVYFPEGGRLCILNAPSPISARKTRLFSPLCRNFDQDQPLEPVYEFNRQIFTEDQEVVESQYPEDLPLDLRTECHIEADKTSIAYRKGLAKLGLSKVYTA